MKRLLFGFVSVVALSAAGSVVHAQQSTPSLSAAAPDPANVGEVVVTARRRTERLRDVPVAASVIGSGDIDQRGGLTGVKDLVTAIPSVAFGDTSTPLTSEISIRGSGTSRGTSADSGVGLYRDGAFVGGGAQGGRTFSRFDLFDISQIEVLRGTQGALYGRDAVGGAINIISARPTQRESGYVSVKAGNVEYAELEAVVNHPLTDHLAVRLSADLMSQPGGFYENPDFNTYIDAQASHAFRGQLRYENGRFDANLLVEHAENKYPALNLQLYIQPNPSEPSGVLFQSMFSRPHNTKDLDKDEVDDVEFASNYRFGFATLTSITLLRNRRTIQQFDNDLFDPALLAQVVFLGLLAPGVTFDPNGGRKNQGHTTTFNQQLYLSGDIGRQLKWLAGFEYLNQNDADTIVIQRTPTKANTSIGTSSPTTQSLDSFAVYGSLEYDPTSRLSFTGQLRYTEDDKHFTANQFDLGTGVAAAGKMIDASFTPDNKSYDLTAAYKFLPRWLGYAKVGTAFRAGGFNSNLGDPRQPIPVPVSYGNEETTSYELGVKGNLSNHLYVTAAAYYTDIGNLIIQTDNGCSATNRTCPVAQTNFATDGGQAHVSGIEAEARVSLPLLGGILAGTFGGSTQTGKITAGVFSGDQPPQLPRYLASANLGYTHGLPSGFTGFSNLVYSARWGGVQEIAQTPQLHDYQLVNVRFGVRRGHVELAGYVNNIGDVTYISFESLTSRRFTQPRTYGGQVIYRW